MAARILADRRYTGEGGFPSIIPEGQFHMVQARRQERTTPCQKSPAQKELRKLCGGAPPAWVERQVLGLLNRLIQCPERITCSVLEDKPPPEVMKPAPGAGRAPAPPAGRRGSGQSWPSGLAPLQLNAIGRRSMKPLRLREAAFQGTGTHGRTGAGTAHESVRRITVSNGQSPSC